VIDCKDLDYVALDKLRETIEKKTQPPPQYVIDDVILQIKNLGWAEGSIDMLDWMLNQTMTGMTLPMLRAQIHNKRVEISGEGERA